ncbi:MAG: HAMP domain-containing protein [Candidatus Sericytochromatia bacterium]|nr:HAMP domain-containing protein [Candidatus Sericytochromatia bacterium]
MNWFINLKMRVKLFFTLGLILLIMIALLTFAYRSKIDVQNSEQLSFNKNFNNAVDIMNFKANNIKQYSNVISISSTQKNQYSDQLLKERKELILENTQLIKKLHDNNLNDKEFTKMIDELSNLREISNKFASSTVLPLIEQQKYEEAKVYIFGIQKDRFIRIVSICDKIRDSILESSSQNNIQSKKNLDSFFFIFLISALVAIAFTIAIAMFLNKIISEPIQLLSLAAERVTKGNLNIDLNPIQRYDEIGLLINTFVLMVDSIIETSNIAKQIETGKLDFVIKPKSENDVLLNSFSSMLTNFKKMTNVAQNIAKGDLTYNLNPSEHDILAIAFKNMVDNLRNIISEIQATSSFLVTTSGEISANTSELSAGMMETATSINQTTATVEEVKQTAQISLQKARQVVDLAQKTAQVSQAGKKSLDESVASMEEIRRQMDFVSDSVIRLSEQTQAISDIISTIDGLAEQSNLLAVNAAIEAAKANEHGRGFSVVAQEVRKLSEQSKQATSQVRTILSNVQKATNTAVITAEQGNKSVDEGIKKSALAKDAIQTLSASIIEAAQASTQISASAHQQLIGMEQIASAMESIKIASIQNASNTKQVDLAMTNFQKINQKLTSLSNTYKL